MNPRIHVLIGQAYFLRFDPTLWAAQQPYPPLGALYAAACVRQAGHTVSLFDAMLASSEDEWESRLEDERPSVAVLFEDNFNYLTKMCLLRMREVATRMIAAAVRRQVPMVVAGSDATDHPDLYLAAGATAVIAGEGEVTLVALLDAVRQGGVRQGSVAWSDIPGVVVQRDGQAVRSAPRPAMRDLNALPRPAWDLVDMARYQTIWRRAHGYFSLNISTTRGCPYHCNWCAKPIYGQRYTVRSAGSCADEIAWLRQHYAPSHLWITDDIFGLRPGWIEEFAAAIVDRHAVTPFKCLMRADGISRSIVAALRAAGCRTVWIGAESGSQRVLDAMDKGTRVADIDTACRLLRDAGIDVGLFLQFGYPGETRADIALTLDMVARCRPADIGISVSYPLPGTPFHERVRAELGPKQNWMDSSDLATMYRATYEPAFYRALHPWVHAHFRLQRASNALSEWRVTRRDGLMHVLDGAAALLRLPLLASRVRRLSRPSRLTASGSDTTPHRTGEQPGSLLSASTAAVSGELAP